MYVIDKHALSSFMSTGCLRQLRIHLLPEKSRTTDPADPDAMPEKLPRPGLQDRAQVGDEWANECVEALEKGLPSASVVADPVRQRTGKVVYKPMPLSPQGLRAALPGQVLVEHEYPVTSRFQAAFPLGASAQGLPISYSNLRPDLIFVRAPGSEGSEVLPDGEVRPIQAGDDRVQLRVVDIKLNENPGTGYLMESVLYSVVLAGWLDDHGLEKEFLVRSDCAIWPGSHAGSTLDEESNRARDDGRSLNAVQVMDAVDEDLQIAQPSVFVTSLRKFFAEHVPAALAPADWKQLPFHVQPACRGCDFLGMVWKADSEPHPNACVPTTEVTEHLSRIPNVSRGAAGTLRKGAHAKVSTLPSAPDEVFDEHHSLRGKRTVIRARAGHLTTPADAALASSTSATAGLPAWVDASIYVVANFDSSTAITFTLGTEGTYWPRGEEKLTLSYRQVVNRRALPDEQRVLINFLGEIGKFIRGVQARNEDAKVQVYLWDELTYKHLCRVVGRHLDAILAQPDGVKNLVWLFPPEEVVANSAIVSRPVISLVGQPVESLLSSGTPFYYSLLGTAREYHRPQKEGKEFGYHVHPLWEDPLSNQIPSERAHERWKHGPHSDDAAAQALVTTSVQRSALRDVTERLRADLRLSGGLRREAPRVKDLQPPKSPGKLTADEMLWLAHARLDQAIALQDRAQVHALGAVEREATFESALLRRRLHGQERTDALDRLGLPGSSSLEVYEVEPTSCDAKFAEGDFTCAVVPRDELSILDQRLSWYLRSNGVEGRLGELDYRQGGAPMSDVLQVTVRRFARDDRLVVVEPTTHEGRDVHRAQLQELGVLDLDGPASLEKLSRDFFTGKLTKTLKRIGRTPKAVDHMLSRRATGLETNPRRTPRVPAEDLLWDPSSLAGDNVASDVPSVRQALESAGLGLDENQWDAVEHALTHRLSIIWGPPGTGKSRTLSRILGGTTLEAQRSGEGLRVLLTANTYDAVDNVMAAIAVFMPSLVPSCELWRLRSNGRSPAVPPVLDCVTGTDEETKTLRRRLSTGTTDITIVAATPQQLHKLVMDKEGKPLGPEFDLVVVDEASQINVATAILSLVSMAEGSRVIVAGDRLQLAPITKVEPPVGLEHMVGSLYDFLVNQHRIPEQSLLTNYRSNAEIVEGFKSAGYRRELHSADPGKRMVLSSPLPGSMPSDWPVDLPWTDYSTLLDPEVPVVCVLHDDELSGQANELEAGLVVAIARLLGGRLGSSAEPGAGHLGLDAFLERGLGVVTPHRAQQSRITALLGAMWPTANRDLLRKAVDTVEHFQGQEREVVVASYGVGDPDLIAGEDEFLQSLNRFNVTASRPKTKLVVLTPRTLVEHLSSDVKVLEGSAFLKQFVDRVCSNSRPLQVTTGSTTATMEMRWS